MQNGRTGTCLQFSDKVSLHTYNAVMSWKTKKSHILHPLQVRILKPTKSFCYANVWSVTKMHKVSFHLPFSVLSVVVLLLFFLSSIQPLQLNWTFHSQRQQQFSASSENKQFWTRLLCLALWDSESSRSRQSSCTRVAGACLVPAPEGGHWMPSQSFTPWAGQKGKTSSFSLFLIQKYSKTIVVNNRLGWGGWVTWRS